MESYRTEEEQVEALKRWWQENGRSTLIGVGLAVGLSFGWQAWQSDRETRAENASVLYQQLLQTLSEQEGENSDLAMGMAGQLKTEHAGSSYAQFAALHLARMAVNDGRLEDAEAELRWVLAEAEAGSDFQQVAQLRLARVVASGGDTEQALTLLESTDTGYAASYAIARGDVLLAAGREQEALAAYRTGRSLLEAGRPVPQTLEDKIQYLSAGAAAPAVDD